MTKHPFLIAVGAGIGFFAIGAYLYVSYHISSPSATGYEKLWDWQLMFYIGMFIPILCLALLSLLVVKLLIWRVGGGAHPRDKEN